MEDARDELTEEGTERDWHALIHESTDPRFTPPRALLTPNEAAEFLQLMQLTPPESIGPGDVLGQWVADDVEPDKCVELVLEREHRVRASRLSLDLGRQLRLLTRPVPGGLNRAARRRVGRVLRTVVRGLRGGRSTTWARTYLTNHHLPQLGR